MLKIENNFLYRYINDLKENKKKNKKKFFVTYTEINK